MTEARGHVTGARNAHHITFYGLSTCIWCRKTREFLEEQGVQFDFVYVDLLQGAEREEALNQVRHWNPATSFPTTVVDGTICVVGYKPEQLQEVLDL
jgi:glutaredoxin